MQTLKNQLKRFRKIIIFLSIVIVLLIIVLLNNRNRAPEVLPDIAIEQVDVRDVELIVSSNGFLETTDKREVYLPTQAKVTELNVKIGTLVNTDSWLAKYETKNAFGRTIEDDIFPPIKGMITAINYKVNDVVNNPSLPAFEVVNVNSRVVKVDINENDIKNLAKKQTVNMVFPAISLDQKFKGEVTFISPTPIQSAGAVNYTVEITPQELPKGYKLGMSVDVEILAKSVQDVLAVPESFLIEKDDKYFVKQLEWKNSEKTEYEIKEVEVTVGLVTDEYAEVITGVSKGTELVEPSFTVERSFGLFGN